MNENGIFQEKIENTIDSNFSNIKIDVSGCSVTIKGTVNSFEEKTQIENITWNTFGVEFVNNELDIAYRF
ncbi:BON domain-containing protein [Flavobacterium sp.]|uniref:BON domain-containing protein n=1 Tax=Flavobacterium sp. TaxID=239 RepID=UPI003750A71D